MCCSRFMYILYIWTYWYHLNPFELRVWYSVLLVNQSFIWPPRLIALKSENENVLPSHLNLWIWKKATKFHIKFSHIQRWNYSICDAFMQTLRHQMMHTITNFKLCAVCCVLIKHSIRTLNNCIPNIILFRSHWKRHFQFFYRYIASFTLRNWDNLHE